MRRFTSLLYKKQITKGSNQEPNAENPTVQRGETLTWKLPPEILSVVFDYLGRNSRDLAHVTAVCTRWREIAIHCPYLWTNIIVQTRGIGYRQLSRHLSDISLSLDRAGGLPLDVEWHANLSESVGMFDTLFRTKGTFDRWRTLSLDIDHTIGHAVGPAREVDKFCNLTYLKLLCIPPREYLNLIGGTASAKFHTLELASMFQCSLNFHADYRELLERITTLIVWSCVTIPTTPLPRNVTSLHVYTIPDLPASPPSLPIPFLSFF